MAKNNSESDAERELSVHIFSVSAQLVGLCLTAISLVRVVVQLKSIDTVADNVLSADAVLFLCACMFAYASLRSNQPSRRQRLERVADLFFAAGLFLMTGVCALIAWQLA